MSRRSAPASSASIRCWSRTAASAAPACTSAAFPRRRSSTRRMPRTRSPTRMALNAIGLTLGSADTRLRQDDRLEGCDRRAPRNRGRRAPQEGGGAILARARDHRRRQERDRARRHRRSADRLRASRHRDRLRADAARRAAVRRRGRPLLDRGAGADQGPRDARRRRGGLYRHGARHGLRQARRESDALSRRCRRSCRSTTRS